MIARIIKRPKAEADNTNRDLDNFAIMRKPNPIIEVINFGLKFAAFYNFFLHGLWSIVLFFAAANDAWYMCMTSIDIRYP